MTVDHLDIIIVAAIGAIAPTIAALAAWRKAREIHVLVNGRMAELIRLTQERAEEPNHEP